MKKFILALVFVFFFQASVSGAARAKSGYVGLYVSIFYGQDIKNLVVSARKTKNRMDEDFSDEKKFKVVSVDQAGETREERFVGFREFREFRKCDPAVKTKCEGVSVHRAVKIMMKYQPDIKSVQIFDGDKLLGSGIVR